MGDNGDFDRWLSTASGDYDTEPRHARYDNTLCVRRRSGGVTKGRNRHQLADR